MFSASLRRKLLVKLLMASDLFLFAFCWLYAKHLANTYQGQIFSLTFLPITQLPGYFARTLHTFLANPLPTGQFFFLLAIIFLWHTIFFFFGLYTSRRMTGTIREALRVLKATTLGTAALIPIYGLLPVTATYAADRFFLLFWLLLTILAVAVRWTLRLALILARLAGRNLRFVLIVGSNPRACSLARELERKREFGYRIVGFLDSENRAPEEKITLLGRLEDFSRIIRTTVIDEVVIALPVKSYYDKIQEIIDIAETQGIIVRFLSEFFSTKIAQTRTESFPGFSIVTLASGPQGDLKLLTKRAMDLAVSTAILLITLPMMIGIAIAIKLDDGGPVLFTQKRIGYNKRIFTMYKFRTMIENAETLQAALEQQNEMDGAAFKIRDDPRITPVGRWLRKTSLDELPQLFNVLLGDMSLVGPRPLPVRDYEEFHEDWHRRRFSVKPGITCTWQVSGRNDIPFERWMEMDMEYIDTWSLTGDLKILLKTIPAVLRGTGAA